MKIYITTISLLLSFISTHVESPTNNIDSLYQATDKELQKNLNNDIIGLWVNEKGNRTKSITKCKISYKGNGFVVQMWGACLPQDCDWGENVANELEKGTNKFELFWDQEFAESAITYEIIDGKLEMTHNRHYKDNSGRPDATLIEYFIKE